MFDKVSKNSLCVEDVLRFAGAVRTSTRTT